MVEVVPDLHQVVVLQMLVVMQPVVVVVVPLRILVVV
jgi:hypothetical protein